MESILAELFRQHRDAEGMLAKLAAGVGRVRREGVRGAGILDDLRDLRREIQGEVLSHFREEEQALFPVLGRHIDSASGPIAMLMEEHAIFRLKDGWEEKVCDAGEAIARMLPGHIEKEESVVFPMAEEMLGEEEWNDVGRLWKEALAAVLPT